MAQLCVHWPRPVLLFTTPLNFALNPYLGSVSRPYPCLGCGWARSQLCVHWPLNASLAHTPFLSFSGPLVVLGLPFVLLLSSCPLLVSSCPALVLLLFFSCPLLASPVRSSQFQIPCPSLVFGHKSNSDTAIEMRYHHPRDTVRVAHRLQSFPPTSQARLVAPGRVVGAPPEALSQHSRKVFDKQGSTARLHNPERFGERSVSCVTLHWALAPNRLHECPALQTSRHRP